MLKTAARLRLAALASTLLALVLAAVPLPAQNTLTLLVTVTDPLNRFVTGLDRDHFEVVAGGVRRSIAGFVDADSPITIAVVSASPGKAFDLPDGATDVLIQTRSVDEALRQLQASSSQRKCLVITAPGDFTAVPRGVQVVRTSPENVQKAVADLRSRYVMEIEGDGLLPSIEIMVRQPRGLPALRAQLASTGSR